MKALLAIFLGTCCCAAALLYGILKPGGIVDMTFALECRQYGSTWSDFYRLRLAYEHGRPVGGTTIVMDDMDVVEATDEHVFLRDPDDRKEAEINRYTGVAVLKLLQARKAAISLECRHPRPSLS